MARAFEPQYDKRSGFLGMESCPDCGTRMIGMRKVMRGGAIGLVTAKACVNPDCAHFTDVNALSTWVGEDGTPMRGPSRSPDAAKYPWVYSKNDHD